MRVAVQHPGALRPGEQEPAVEQGRVVAGLLVALADDLGEGGAVHPLADQDVAGLRDDLGDVEVGVVQVGVPEEPLGLGLDRVVELLGHPLLELGEHRLDVQSGHQHAEEPPSRASWLKSLISALPTPGYCTFTATARPSCQTARCTCPMDAAAAAGRRTTRSSRASPRRGTSPAPCGRSPRAAGSGLLQPGQRGAVRPGDLRRQRRLEDREHLAELHRPALELAEHREQLLGGPGLDLHRHGLGRSPEGALPHAEGGAPREADGEGRQLC